MLKRLTGIILVLFLAMGSAIADDWVVSKMRGGVFVFKAGAWVQLERGDVISDDSAIQTAKHARVVLTRGKESISVASDTRIRIADKNGAKRTVVSQDFGEITVDVEKRNVQHFEVRAPLLAAVVKGTKFTVKARGSAASIDVARGRVEARDDRANMKVDVLPRQSVEIDVRENPVLTVEGRGEKEPIRSTKNGKVLSVKEIVSQAAVAHPETPVQIEKVLKIAAQQGVKVSKSDIELAAKTELKVAKQSGDAVAVAKAQAQVNAVSANSGAQVQSTADVKAQGKAAEEAAKSQKKQAEEALKEAKKTGDQAAIAAASQAVEQAKENEQAVKEETKKAEEAAEAAEKAAKEAAKAAEEAAEAEKKAAEEALKDAKKSGDASAINAATQALATAKASETAVKDANKEAEEATKQAAEAEKKAQEAAEKAAKEAAKAEKKAQEAAEKAAKEAAEAEKKAQEAAEKAAKEAADAAKDALKV